MQINYENRFDNLTILDYKEQTKIKEETQDKIREAIGKIVDNTKEYKATREQLEEYPWLKNADYGINKISDILNDYENGVDGSGTFIMSSGSTDSFSIIDKNNKNRISHAYTIYGREELTTKHLAWDSEDYTREGTQEVSSFTFHIDYLSYEVNEWKHIEFNADGKNLEEFTDFEKLFERLKNDKNFEKEFISNMDNYSNNNSIKLFEQIKRGLEIEDIMLIKQDPISYDNKGKGNFIKNYSESPNAFESFR